MALIERAFWDTSAIVPLCVRQEPSSELRRLARRIKRFAVWWGSTVEARSAFNRLLRDGSMSSRGLNQAIDRLQIQRAAWTEILPSGRVRELAEELPNRFGLRALDSFQLAAALVWCKEHPRGRLVVSCDLRLSLAATEAGFTVLP